MPHLLKLSLLPAVVASILISACGGGGSSGGKTGSTAGKQAAPTPGGGSGEVVKTASSSSLGTILVNAQGMTLYHLSVERNGKFICTNSTCLGVWHPLTVQSGGAPSGQVGSLGTVKRPDGTTQVTYKGTPLYTFAQDQKPGEANGQGIKDVGTWSAVTVSASSSASGSSGTTGTPAPSSGGGGYGY